jgi:hypothetical protein
MSRTARSSACPIGSRSHRTSRQADTSVLAIPHGLHAPSEITRASLCLVPVSVFMFVFLRADLIPRSLPRSQIYRESVSRPPPYIDLAAANRRLITQFLQTSCDPTSTSKASALFLYELWQTKVIPASVKQNFDLI